MPSKHRFRILAALGVSTVIVITPQLAGAGSASPEVSRVTVKASAAHHHRHHKRRHHHHSHPSTTTTSTTTFPVNPDPAPSPDPQPVPIPIPIPIPNPTPTPGPAPHADGTCLTQSPTTVRGTQSNRYKPSVSGHLAVDARGATWTQVDPWPVSVDGSGRLCWNGGSIVGTYSNNTPWATFHHTGAFNFTNPDSVIEDLRVHNYGDAINVRDGASNWTVRGAHTTFIHDDCLQDDYLNAGVIDRALFDGCYVGISTRPSKSNTTSDGRHNTLTLANSLLRLQPMPTVYKGPAPGHGGFFKWDDTGRSPKLALVNNVFRVDQTPNHGSLGLPSGYDVTCSGNTIVWLGGGSFPEAASWKAKCPDTRIVTNQAAWDDAVAAWTASH